MEYLVSVVVWMLAVYGSSLVVVMSSILKPFRDFISYSKITKRTDGTVESVVIRRFSLPGKLIGCMMCFGWWSGAFWGYVFWDPFSKVDSSLWLHFIFNGMVGSSVTWIIHLHLAPKMQGQ